MRLVDKMLICSVIADNNEKVKYYIGRGANANTTDGRDNTPLMFVKSGAVARTLLQKGANPNATNCNGDSVLILLAKRLGETKPRLASEVFLDIWRELKQFDVDVLIKNNDNKIARDYLNANDGNQKRASILIAHREANQKIARGRAAREESKGKK